MKLHVDVRKLIGACEPADATAARPETFDLDLRRLPWGDGAFAAIELDDVPDPADWAVSGPALNEVRRVLRKNGFLEVRTRKVDAKTAQAVHGALSGTLTRLLQNHGFDVVSVDPVDDQGTCLAAIALRTDGPEDALAAEAHAIASHVTLHAPLLDDEEISASHRALAVALDAQGVRIRVRVIFDVVDALYDD